MEVSIHLRIIVVRILILFPLMIVYINYNYHHIYWISNDLIHIELESASMSYYLWPCSLAITRTGRVGLRFCDFVQEHPKAHRQWLWF